MNGKRAKQIRKTQGLSIAARRELRQFDRTVATSREDRAARRVDSMRTRRVVFAVAALAVIAAVILGGLFL